MNLLERFAHVCRETPDKEVVIQGDERSCYRDLGARCANVAQYMISNGISRGDRVALVLQNSLQYIAVYYGIWFAGGVTVALNTQAKAHDIENWTRHADAKWLFIDDNHPELPLLAGLQARGVRVIPVPMHSSADRANPDAEWEIIQNNNSPLPETKASEDNLASIIYTSGTTGHPKGVTLSHGNLASNVESILDYLNISSSDSIVNVLPFYYSYGNSILHTHIAKGARLILENSLLYPHRVVDRIAIEQATGFSGVPSTFSLILGRVNLNDFDLTSLRYVTQAGGPMPPVLIDKLLDALPGVEFFVMYGQTEATARLTYLDPEQIVTKRGSIGKAISGVSIEIRNKDNIPVQPGETGEICAKGPNIMQGYWKDPDQTQATIKAGWLHTGDLAHCDNDGYIYIDGRASDMIKTGGNRISPKEVEEVIQELDGVQDVAVVGIPDEMLGETIRAFIVPAADSNLEKRTVQFHCKNRLAIYKIPKTIVFVDELPKTASGKIQRFLLQSRDDVGSAG